MNRKQWMAYWMGIVSIPLLIQMFHFCNYVTQPSLGEFYTGKSVVYSAILFVFSGVIFVCVNIFAFLVCFKNHKLYSWIFAFVVGVVFLIVSEFALSKISEQFFPLNVWEQSTLKKLQSESNSK